MATQLKLDTLNANDPYLQKIKKALENGTGQDVVIINVSPVKRISGVSACAVEFVFSGNQALKLYVRASADVFKAELNGKTIVLGGDFSNDLKMTFDNGVNSTSKAIRDNQKKFQEQSAKQRVKIPSTSTPKPSVTAQLKQIQETEKKVDQDISEKIGVRDHLLEQISQIKAQKNIKD